MYRFAGIFLQMRASQTDRFLLAIIKLDANITGANDRQLKLRNLIALGQVGIEVILARKHAATTNLGAGCQRELDRHRHRFAIEHRQHTRHPQINGIGLRVGCRAKRGGTGREDLALRGQLSVNLQTDNGFPLHRGLTCSLVLIAGLNAGGNYEYFSGSLVCQSVTCWN